MNVSADQRMEHVYQLWLGIPEEQCPPDHYQLLGLKTFESDPQQIEAAADRRMQLLREQQLGRYRRESQKLLNDVAEARICLLSANEKQSYDRHLAAHRRTLYLSPLPVPLETISPDEIPMRTPDHLRSPKLLSEAMPQAATRDASSLGIAAVGNPLGVRANWKVVIPASFGVMAILGLLFALLWRLS